jgi:5-methylcytosine-specific restriction protein A
MPSAPLRPCSPSCPALVTKGKCETCRKATRKELDRFKYDSKGRYLYGRRWRKRRHLFLLRNPYCADCEREGIVALATDVDHSEPHRGDLTLFWNDRLWVGRCKRHHSKKTALETWGK